MIFCFENLHNSLGLPRNGVHLLKSACPTAPCDIKPMPYDWYFSKFNKHNVSPPYLQQEFLALKTKYMNYCLFYIDGSKSLSYHGCAVGWLIWCLWRKSY